MIVGKIKKFFKQMGKEILAFMPWEDSLPGYANQNKILIAEQPNTQWVKILRVLMGRLSEITPSEKQWASNVAAAEFSHGSDMLWRQLEKSAEPENISAMSKLAERPK